MRVAMRFAYCGEAVLEIECGHGIKFFIYLSKWRAMCETGRAHDNFGTARRQILNSKRFKMRARMRRKYAPSDRPPNLVDRNLIYDDLNCSSVAATRHVHGRNNFMNDLSTRSSKALKSCCKILVL